MAFDGDGSGRLTPEDLHSPTVWMPPEELIGLRPGDRVTISVEDRPHGRERGHLLRLEERGGRSVVGVLIKRARATFVDVQPAGVPVVVTDRAGAKPGQVVVVEIEQEARGRRPAGGRVVSILGSPRQPRVQIEILTRAQGLAMEFSPAALAEAAALDEVSPQRALACGHRDLRDVEHVTVDGADARDFDDAIAARWEGDQVRVWISIADVSSYVRPRTALDAEASTRGTSVYFPHRAIPMLPERLSSHLCSLRPREPRLCLTCELCVDPDGARHEVAIYPSLIESRARLTYDEVQAGFDGRGEVAYPSLLDAAGAAAGRLRQARRRRGAIDLELPEPEVVFGPDAQPRTIRERPRWEAHRLIEDLMIAANEAVAEHLLGLKRPAVFRVHEPPDRRRIEHLSRWAQTLGLTLDANRAGNPKVLAQFAARVRDLPQATVGQTLLLRSLAQAHYARANLGHYALASRAYLHFTSPIRRYPDLLVHRCLRALWCRQSSPAGLGSHADRASVAERRAMEAERTVMQLYACQVAALHVGKVFSCTVVGVHRAGAFVRVQDPFLEGLVRSETLPDDYDVLEEEMSLIGRRSGKRISVGDRLELVLSSVNLSRRLIDFAPPRAKPAPSQRPAGRRPRPKVQQTHLRKPRRAK